MATVTGSKRLLELEVTSVEASTITASGTVTASGGNSSNWNTAYGWGNHATAGYLVSNSDGSDLQNVRAETVEVTIKNTSGSSIAKGTPVHQTGTSGAATFEVTPALAGTASTMPAHFIAAETLADQAEGRGILMGRISGVDTSSFSEGDTIYVGASGGFTNVAPTGEGNKIQNLGIVTRVDATNGGGEVYGAGRSNATPNLNNGNIFIGNGSNQAVTASLSTSVSGLSHYNNTNWDTAYGWGDHASAGYLTSYTETDPIFSASAASGITSTNISNWNTAYGWGDHSTEGYLTSYTETDPTVPSHVKSITSTNISNWNTAYGWGDHSQAGYLTSETDSQTLSWNGSTGQLTISNGNSVDIDGRYVEVAGDKMTGNLEIEKSNPLLVLRDNNTVTSSYPGIQFDTSNNQGVLLQHNEFDNELPVGGYGLVLGPSGANSQFPSTGTLSLVVRGEIYAGDTTTADTNRVWHAGDFTSTNVSNWNTAYGWGDHSTEGYLTSYTETDPTVPSHVKSITSTNISNWNTAYGWGNHASAGYLTSVPDLPASKITSGTFAAARIPSLAASKITSGTFDAARIPTLSQYLRSDQADTATGKITFSGGIDGFTLANGISGSNFNITGVNQLSISDPGEGIVFGGGTNTVTLAAIDDANDNIMNFDGAAQVQVDGRRVFEANYHPNADKWTTARTLSLTGAVTGSASFDGSGNISLATTATADPTLTLSGDASGSATFTNLGNATLTVTVADDSHNHVISNVDGLQAALDGKESTFTKNTAFNKDFGTALGTVAQGNDSRINNGQTAFGWGDHASEGYLTGNQTITLTGDVSGSGTTSISVTVADDSHNHVISNVDGLQTALDAKAPKASPTFTGTVNIPAVNFSGASSLAVGSYVFAYETGLARSARSIGDTLAGSNLKPVAVMGNNPDVSTNAVYSDIVVMSGTDDNSALSGTWRLMGGYADNTALNDYPATLWLRIS